MSGTRPQGPFGGVLVALPTPFDHGQIDWPSLRGLIERQLGGGASGVVVGGSTGEATSLATAERIALFEFTCGLVQGRLQVLAGVGSGDTRVAVELARAATRTGADGLLVTTPAYARPPQRGLEAHFGAVADASELPQMLYNIPARTGVDLLPETVARLAGRHGHLVALKESSGSLERVRRLVAEGHVDVFCGDDAEILDHLEAGAVGVVSVMANLVPGRTRELIEALMAGEQARAGELSESLRPLIHALTLETNPGPLKAALDLLGLAGSETRLPLVPIEDATRTRVAAALVDGGLCGRQSP